MSRLANFLRLIAHIAIPVQIFIVLRRELDLVLGAALAAEDLLEFLLGRIRGMRALELATWGHPFAVALHHALDGDGPSPGVRLFVERDHAIMAGIGRNNATWREVFSQVGHVRGGVRGQTLPVPVRHALPIGEVEAVPIGRRPFACAYRGAGEFFEAVRRAVPRRAAEVELLFPALARSLSHAPSPEGFRSGPQSLIPHPCKP